MRIAIVNDLLLAVEAMRRVLISGAGHELAWVAGDGAEAVALCAQDRPDLILMDLLMPRMDGVEATRRIMASTPCPILVVTASVNRTSAKVFEALGAGALDAVNTPVLEPGGFHAGGQALRSKVDTLRRLLGAGPGPRRLPQPEDHPPQYPRDHHLVVLGASAGGPAALATVLGALPHDFPAAVVIVQHVDAQFAPGLAEWLGAQTALAVRLANDGERPQPGTALLASGAEHLVLQASRRLAYSHSPADLPYRPSVDVLFRSVDQHWTGTVTGVVLTGMGRDGAEGLRLLRSSGHLTIAQDELTSAVYGMPKAAAQLDAACEILAVERIGPRLLARVAARVGTDG